MPAQTDEILWSPRYIRMNLSCFFQYITHYLLIAALPVFTIQTLQQSENVVGWVLTFFQVGAILFRPLAGLLMDRYDKKRVLMISLAFFSGVCFLYLGVQTLSYLLGLRLLLGAAFAAGTTATATLVAILSPASRKGEGVGYFAAFTSIAMVLGPFFGLTLISAFSPDWLFVVVAACGLMAFLCGNIDWKAEGRMKSETRASLGWRNLIEPAALPIACCGALLSVIYGSLLGFLPIYAENNNMLDKASWFFAIYALSIIVLRPFIGRLFDRIGPQKIVFFAASVYFAGFILLSQARGPMPFLMSAALIGAGFGGLNPSFQALAVLAAPPHRSGLATSTYLLSMDVGVGVGSAVMGLIAYCSGYRVMYLCCALLVLMLAGLFYRINDRNERTKGESHNE